MIYPEKVAIFAGGDVRKTEALLAALKNYNLVIAVNGGSKVCKTFSIIPHLIIGDLDSLPKKLAIEYASVPRKEFPKDKDHTDLELALMEASSHATDIALIGAFGKRLDHSLYNLYLLRRYYRNVTCYSGKEVIFVVEGHKKLACLKHQRLSLIPLYDCARGVTTKGLKWELQDRTIDDTFMSLSNICLSSEVEISIGNGKLICILENNPKLA